MNREFPIATPVRFLWRDSYGALHLGVGISHHISRSDVRIRAQHVPSVGARVQVIVDMPPAKGNTRPGRLTGHGVVEYVEHEDRQPAALQSGSILRRGGRIVPRPSVMKLRGGRTRWFRQTGSNSRLLGQRTQNTESFFNVNVYKQDGRSR